jgi:hypothetical protein
VSSGRRTPPSIFDVMANTLAGSMPRWRTPTSTGVRGEAEATTTSTPLRRAHATSSRTSGRMRPSIRTAVSTRSAKVVSSSGVKPA